MTGQVGNDGSGVGALGLLEGPFLGTGFPSLQGGHAGPSSAGASNNGDAIFSNAFSVAGRDGSASSSPSASRSGFSNWLVLGVVGLIALKVLKK